MFSVGGSQARLELLKSGLRGCWPGGRGCAIRSRQSFSYTTMSTKSPVLPPPPDSDEEDFSDLCSSTSSASTFVEIDRASSRRDQRSGFDDEDDETSGLDEWTLVEQAELLAAEAATGALDPPLQDAPGQQHADAGPQRSRANSRNTPRSLAEPKHSAPAADSSLVAAPLSRGSGEAAEIDSAAATPPTESGASLASSFRSKPHGKSREVFGNTAQFGSSPLGSPTTDEALARLCQEEEDAAFAQALFEAERGGGRVGWDGEMVWDDPDDADDADDAPESAGPHGLTDDQLLSLLPLSDDRRARIVGEYQRLGGSLAQPLAPDSDHRRDRNHRWTRALHPSSKAAASFEYDEEYSTTLPTPSTSSSSSSSGSVPLCDPQRPRLEAGLERRRPMGEAQRGT